MADRRTALRAMARQLATERADRPGPRPASARIPLPDQHLVDLAAARTHQVRLTVSTVDPDRFAAALRSAAAQHDALRLRPVRDSGRHFLADTADTADTTDPVGRVAGADELDRADPDHPLRWAMSAGPGGCTLTLAVSAYLVDRSAWAALLSTVEAAYGGIALPTPALDYGDYCYWLAHRGVVDPAAPAVVAEIGHPAEEPYWAFAAGQPWAVLSRSVPAVQAVAQSRTAAAALLAGDLAAALRVCGWQAPGVRTLWWCPRPPGTQIVGRVDEPVVGVVRPGGATVRSAAAVAVGAALDPWWASFPEPAVLADVDVLDLPVLRLGGETVRVEPVLSPSPGWQCLLVRGGGDAVLHLAGPGPTLAALHDAVAGRVGGGPVAVASGGDRVVDGPDGGELTVPRLVTPHRTVPADLGAAAVDRRAQELHDAGVRPGRTVVIECTEGPETVANLFAAWRCRADVLLIDPADPPDWREGLLALAPAAVSIGADNLVRAATADGSPHRPPAAPERSGDGDGALLLGLSSDPAGAVLARVPLDELRRAARVLAVSWGLGAAAPVAVNAARAGEDAVLRMLAAARCGADLLLVGGDAAEAVDLLTPGTLVDRHLAADWAVPVHRTPGVRWSRRGVEPAPELVTTWWAAEAPEAQWLATGTGLRLRSGTARVVDSDGRARPEGTVGELAVGVGVGSRYLNDPRRTADRLRPAPEGRRELRTATLVGRLGADVLVLRHAQDRAVVHNRTCLTDAWRTMVADGFVGTAPVGSPTAEAAFVVSARPVEPAGLPRPLRDATVRVDPSAAGLDFAGAWHRVQAPVRSAVDESARSWASEQELTLATEVVEPVLGMPVGRDDDLFSLGVTSLQLMRVLLQVKERTGVEVPLARFFATPTVAVLAELVKEPTDATAAAMDLIEEIEGEA